MTADVETIVVGAGVIGLAIARALAMRGDEVLVLDRHARAGSETSSRNSEVIHAGLYYPPGSLKARMCVTGKEALYRFCAENGVAFERVGKMIVATTEEECLTLSAIAETARRNGVADLALLSGAEARRLEPEVACRAALLSPSSGAIDSHGLIIALEGHLTARRGMVQLRSNVTRLWADGGFAVEVEQVGGRTATVTSRKLILSGGLGATQLGEMIHGTSRYRPPSTTFAKGHYFALAGPSPFERLIYPVPGGGGLGIHATRDVAGRVRFGPDIEWTEELNYKFEDASGARFARFEHAVRRYWPGLPEGALVPESTGIRPKLTRAGEPAADFAIHGPREHGLEGLVALYGMESPGLTSCLAIGEFVAEMICRGP